MFEVVRISRAIKKCYGCKQPFREKYRKEPRNIILKVLCHRVYANPYGQRVKSQLKTAAYVHLKMSCVRKYNQDATPDSIKVTPEVAETLMEEQLDLLAVMGVHMPGDDALDRDAEELSSGVE